MLLAWKMKELEPRGASTFRSWKRLGKGFPLQTPGRTKPSWILHFCPERLIFNVWHLCCVGRKVCYGGNRKWYVPQEYISSVQDHQGARRDSVLEDVKEDLSQRCNFPPCGFTASVLQLWKASFLRAKLGKLIVWRCRDPAITNVPLKNRWKCSTVVNTRNRDQQKTQKVLVHRGTRDVWTAAVVCLWEEAASSLAVLGK